MQDDAAALADAADAVLRASRALVGVAARSLAQVEDQVTLPQYRALVVLAARGSLRPVDLATVLEVSPSTATRMCDRLVRKGLIDRSHRVSDRREVELTLSDAGRKLIREVTSRRRREIQRIVARLPDRARSQLVAALQGFGEAAGETPDSAWTLGLAP